MRRNQIKIAAVGLMVWALIGVSRASGLEAGMPNPPATPTLVRCGIVIADVVDIDDVNEAFEAEVIIRARWNDPRLAFDPNLEGTHAKIFQGEFQFFELFHGWWPQLVIVNQSGRGDTSGIKVTVFPDGEVMYAEQRSMRLETPMRLHDYPFDNQQLHANMISFGNPVEEVILEVDPDLMNTTNDLVAREKEINVAGWELQRLDMGVDQIALARGSGSEQYRASRLVTTITLQRRSWQLVCQMLFPLLVIVSMIWSIFWIDIDAFADRLNVSFIGVLTIVAYQFVVIDNMPRMSYLTFTDMLLLVSFVAMAATIPQSLVIQSLLRRGRSAAAGQVNAVSRWCFPLVYVLLVVGTTAWFRMT